MDETVDHFPQILKYDGIVAPQNDPILSIFTKNDLFDQIYPINDIFDQIYVLKPEWKNI